MQVISDITDRAPTLDDAQARSVVRLPDGRTARLVYLPQPWATRRRSTGAKAKVVLPSGRWLSVPAEGLEVLP